MRIRRDRHLSTATPSTVVTEVEAGDGPIGPDQDTSRDHLLRSLLGTRTNTSPNSRDHLHSSHLGTKTNTRLNNIHRNNKERQEVRPTSSAEDVDNTAISRLVAG